jgi:hypothetical protein
MKPLQSRLALALEPAAAALLVACAAQPAPPAASPVPQRYAGRCDLVAIEEVPAPVDQSADAVVLVARYSPGDRSRGGAGLSYRFQVARDRAHDLRLHLEAHPTVVCEPDRSPAASAEAAHADVPSFEGQPGERIVPPPPPAR